jgi:hypothetical protein
MTKYTVERWHNREERAWVVTVYEDGYEISSDYISHYGGGKAIAIEQERRARRRYGIED